MILTMGCTHMASALDEALMCVFGSNAFKIEDKAWRNIDSRVCQAARKMKTHYTATDSEVLDANVDDAVIAKCYVPFALSVLCGATVSRLYYDKPDFLTISRASGIALTPRKTYHHCGRLFRYDYKQWW